MTTLREFRPGLWLTELALGMFDVRGAVIVGDDRVLVWDTLSHPRDMAGITKLAVKKPIVVVYSHADWDHCWGTAGLKPAAIVAHEACAERFASGSVQRKLDQFKRKEPGQYDEVVLIPPNIIIKDAAIDLGGVSVTLHPLPGHTKDCLVAHIPEWGVLLAGDTVETPLPVMSKTKKLLPGWIDALSGWAANDAVQTVIPAHGLIGGRAVIKHTLRYLKALRDGKSPDVPETMDDFYTKTHARNLKRV